MVTRNEARGERYARLSDLPKHQIARKDPDPRAWDIVDSANVPVGRVEDLVVDLEAMKVRYFDVAGEGGPYRIPSEHIDLEPSEKRALIRGLERADLGRYSATGHVPSGATSARGEEMGVRRTAAAAAGGAMAARPFSTERSTPPEGPTSSRADAAATERARVVERRPIQDNPPDDLGPDDIRIPIVEEELVVERRPVVKEEIVIRKETVGGPGEVDSDLEKERIDPPESRRERRGR
ncbi:MAG TPA: DUF2382 domain-containing protein [Vicinamibacterales bacterium]